MMCTGDLWEKQMKCDVLIAGSGSMAYLMALIFTDCKKRVAMSANRPDGFVLKDGLRITCDIPGRRTLSISPDDILLNPVSGEIKPGQLAIFTRSASNANAGIYDLELAHDKIVVFATKTFSNRSVVQELKPLLTRISGATILTIQNGMSPEIEIDGLLKVNGVKRYQLLRGIVFGGVFPTGSSCKLKHTIQALGIGNWNGDVPTETNEGSLQRIKQYFSDQTILVELFFGEDYRIKSVSKAAINYLSSVSFIFGAKIGEILGNELLAAWSSAKIDECLLISKFDMGLKINISVTKKIAEEIVFDLRPHYPSMAVDGFRSFCKPERPMNTEISQIDSKFVDFSIGPAPINEFCSDLLNDFIATFNEIAERSRSDALMFGVRFMVKNRSLVGLSAYDFLNLPMLNLNGGKEAFIQYRDQDTCSEKCKGIEEIPIKLASAYHQLKSRYVQTDMKAAI